MEKRIAVVVACLLAAAVAVGRADRQEQVPLRQPLIRLPMQLGVWEGIPQPPLADSVLKVLGADDHLTRAYFEPAGSGVGLFIGYWQSQRQGDTIHSPLNCLPGSGWEPIDSTRISIADPRGEAGPRLPVNRVLIQKGIERQLVLYWYQSRGRIVASEYWGKFYLLADAMRLNRTDGAIVRVIAPVADNAPEAESAAEASAIAFVRELLLHLDRFLPE